MINKKVKAFLEIYKVICACFGLKPCVNNDGSQIESRTFVQKTCNAILTLLARCAIFHKSYV